jgi:hypothetical protein
MTKKLNYFKMDVFKVGIVDDNKSLILFTLTVYIF